MAPPSVVAGLPAATFALAPELREIPTPGEPAADCARCVMLPAALGEGHPWAFHPETRCCTYHPELPNYLAGRALARGGRAAEVVRARIEAGDGVSAWGLAPPAGFDDVSMTIGVRFGRDPSLRCPFWVGGTESCGIWSDRTGVCRSWFCRHAEGALGRQRWSALADLLTWIERELGNLCVERGAAPDDGADADVLVRWYRWCADLVETLDDRELEPVRDRELAALRSTWRELVEQPPAPLDDVVVPEVSDAAVYRGRLGLLGYNDYDAAWVDPAVLDLFARLDGRTSWQQAAADAGVSHDTVRELHRINLLRPVAGSAPARPAIPDLLVPSVRRPITVGSRIWLQGADGLGSVVAPAGVFELLAALDGATSWHAALKRCHSPGVDADLVGELYQAGVLVAVTSS